MNPDEILIWKRELRKRVSWERGWRRHLAFRATGGMSWDPISTIVEGAGVRQYVDFVLVDSCHGGLTGKVALAGRGIIPEY